VPLALRDIGHLRGLRLIPALTALQAWPHLHEWWESVMLGRIPQESEVVRNPVAALAQGSMIALETAGLTIDIALVGFRLQALPFLGHSTLS
jgi:hypothetical protein